MAMMRQKLEPLTPVGLLDGAFFLLVERWGSYARTLLPFDVLVALAGVMWRRSAGAEHVMPHNLAAAALTGAIALRIRAVAVYVRLQVAWLRDERISTWQAWRTVPRVSVALMGLTSSLTMLLPIFWLDGRPAMGIAVAACEGTRARATWRQVTALKTRVGDAWTRASLFHSFLALFTFFAVFGLVQVGLMLADSLIGADLERVRRAATLESPAFSGVLALIALLAAATHRAAFLAVAYTDAQVRASGFDLELGLRQAAERHATRRAAERRDADRLREREVTVEPERRSLLAP